MAGRQSRRRARTRARLIQAAREVIAERGYHEITVADITEAADLGKGTFYLYFDDKANITREVILEGFTGLARQVMARKDEMPKLEWFHESLHAIYVYAEGNRDLFAIMLGEKGALEFAQLAREYLAQVAQDALEDADVLPEDVTYCSPAMLAQFVTGALAQLVLWWSEDTRGLSAGAMADLSYNLFRNGLPVMAADSELHIELQHRRAD
jgi:AcrR family transcriptional regulator